MITTCSGSLVSMMNNTGKDDQVKHCNTGVTNDSIKLVVTKLQGKLIIFKPVIHKQYLFTKQ